MEFIPVNEPLLNGNEKKYLNECIDTGWISSEGSFVKKLEDDFSSFIGVKYGIAVCNGSVAIDIAIRAMKEKYNWEDGDEIIVPNFTIISCAQSVIYNKLKPIFVDAEPTTYNIDVEKIEEVISPRTRAIMVVHIYGLPTDMKKIFELASKYNLRIIEDAAQAHGQSYYDKKCGSMSDIATFSFYANKHVAMGEGGLIVTSDEELANKCKYLKNLCFRAEERFIHEDLGHNYRMSNLQAAVGYAQFERLDEFINIKKKMGALYQDLLKDIPCHLPTEKTCYAENHYWIFPIVLNDDIPFNAKEAMKILQSKGIGCRPFFYPLNSQPILKKMHLTDSIERPISNKIYDRGFYIPSGLNLSIEKIERVSKSVRELF